MSNIVVSALRKSATHERDQEEARRQRRNARLTGETIPRQSSVIPATPGSVAPESNEKAPTKKEMKKKAEAKTNEAASHAAANNTTLKFLGGGGGGLFGKKKKNYGWMTAGSASGANTPGRIMTQGLPGTPAGVVVNAAPERLTSDGARRLGTWREDKRKRTRRSDPGLGSSSRSRWAREEGSAESLRESRLFGAKIRLLR